jgi:hypothetical protein
MELPERATDSGTVTTKQEAGNARSRRRVMNGDMPLDGERQTEL